MRRVICLILFPLISLALSAVTVSGIITDESGKAVSGAVVSDGRRQALSADDGSFTLNDVSNKITVYRIGFYPYVLACGEHDQLGIRIRLKPKPITLPTIRVTESAWDIMSPPLDRVSLPVDPDRHYYSAGEIVTASPAVHSQDVQLAGENQVVSILGNLSRHTLVVLDGVPLNPGGGAYDISLLDTENIESVEIIKNNASVYGGASAIGGVLNITSKKATEAGDQFSIESEIGSFGYAKNSLSFGTSRAGHNLRLSLSNLNTDNDFPYKVPDWWSPDSIAVRENNAKRQNSVSAAYSRNWAGSRLSLQSDFTSFHRQLPGTVNFLDVYSNAFLDGLASRNRVSFNTPVLSCDSGLLAWLNFDSTTYDNTSASLPVFLSKYRQKYTEYGLRGNLGRELPLSGLLTVTAGLAAEAGAERYQNLNLLASGNDLEFDSFFANGSLKSGVELDLDDLLGSASGALRYDYTDREDNLTWRVEGSITHIGYLETTLGGTLGTSYSLPSPYDLYWKGDSQALGNPDLASERSKGWQLWLENRLGSFKLKSTFHHNLIENLIQWRQIQMFGNVWKPVNIGRARIRNLELEAGWQPREWISLSGSAVFTEALDLSTLDESEAPTLMYTPGIGLSAKLDLNWKGFSFWSNLGYTGTQYTTPDNLTDPLPSYYLLDLGMSYKLGLGSWNLTPNFNIRNILNESYEVYAYVPQPGISFYGGFKLQVSD
jgi:vitamin B12 transporter